MNTNVIYDIAIVGGGPAGISATLTAGNEGKKVALINKGKLGGKVRTSMQLNTMAGICYTANMREIYEMQLKEYENVEVIEGEAIYLDYKHGLIMITLADRNIICCKSMIVAIGEEKAKFAIDVREAYNEIEDCQEDLKNKNVMVLEANESGVVMAMELADKCKNVYIINYSMYLNCQNYLLDRMFTYSNIHFLPHCHVVDFKKGKQGQLTSVTLNTYENIKINAVFNGQSNRPNNLIFKPFLTLTDDGYIITGADMKTLKIPGIFAAGSCRNGAYKSHLMSIADGEIAAKEAIKFVK